MAVSKVNLGLLILLFSRKKIGLKTEATSVFLKMRTRWAGSNQRIVKQKLLEDLVAQKLPLVRQAHRIAGHGDQLLVA